MNILRVAATENLQLPFASDEKSLSLWLASLSTSQSIPASIQILKVVQTIGELELKADLKIKFLLRIYNFLPITVEALQKTYLDKSLPLGAEALQNVDRVIIIYLSMAHALHVNLISHPSLAKDAQVLSLHLSLDVLAQALLHFSFGYYESMPGLWQLSYRIYTYAEQANLLSASCKYPKGNKQEKDTSPISIETKFKHFLLYFLSDTQQFRAREQQLIFNYLFDYANAATLSTRVESEMQQASYIFNLQTDQAPHKILSANENQDNDTRYLYCLKAAKNLHASIQQASAVNSLNLLYRDTLSKAAASLGLTRKRKYTRIKKSGSQQHGFVGFARIIDFMRSQNHVLAHSIPQANAPANFDNTAKAAFDLVPLGEEVAHQMRAKFNKPTETKSSMGKIFAEHDSLDSVSLKANNNLSCELVILDSSLKGYGLTTSNKCVDVKIGDILGLHAPNSNDLEISLIRRINQLADQSLHLGVEILSFKSELAYVSLKNQPTTGIWAIFIPPIDSTHQLISLIFNSSLLNVNDIINVKFSSANQNFLIQKTLLSNAAISFVQLTPLQN